jgi:hypothetical protein
MASIWASIRPGAEPEPMSRASAPRPAPPLQSPPSPAMRAAVREAVGSDPEPRPVPPKLGPAETPHPALSPRPVPVLARHRAGWGYAVAWALGIGVGAVAAGAFVGYLVNGPPSHSLSHRQIADVAPPTPDVPPPTAQEIMGSQGAPATIATSAPATPALSSPPAAGARGTTTMTAGRTVLPPIPPAKPGTQAPSPASASPSPPLTSSNDIREVQGRLQSLGFDPGPVDGASGPKTTAAVKGYQQAHGLQPTGVADKNMLDELRQEPGSTAPPSPPPRPRTQAYSYAYTPPARQNNPFMDALNRLFGR